VPELVHTTTHHRAVLAEATDRELLAALKRSDESALAELIARKTRPLVQMVARLIGDAEEARDIAQLTFLRMWEHRARYDERYSPNTWIYRIATNLAIDQWRSAKSRERGREPFKLHLLRQAEERGTHLARLESSEVAAIFRELAAELTEKQRLVFLLREVEGLSSAEVAEIAECEESTVRNHLFNARKVLQRELLRRYPEYGGARAAATAAAR